MKRIILIFIAAAAMSSCIAVKNNPDNKGANTSAKTFIVGNTAMPWIYTDDADGKNGFFYRDQAWSKLDASILGDAVVVAYLKVNGRYQQLPYTMYKENENGDRWAEHIDYDYTPGNITFYVTNSDFYNEYMPVVMEFRAIVMY